MLNFCGSADFVLSVTHFLFRSIGPLQSEGYHWSHEEIHKMPMVHGCNEKIAEKFANSVHVCTSCRVLVLPAASWPELISVLRFDLYPTYAQWKGWLGHKQTKPEQGKLKCAEPVDKGPSLRQCAENTRDQKQGVKSRYAPGKWNQKYAGVCLKFARNRKEKRSLALSVTCVRNWIRCQWARRPPDFPLPVWSVPYLALILLPYMSESCFSRKRSCTSTGPRKLRFCGN